MTGDPLSSKGGSHVMVIYEASAESLATSRGASGSSAAMKLETSENSLSPMSLAAKTLNW